MAQLSSISDCEAIATLLENCLNQDFDGFDIALDEAFAEGRLLGPCWDDNFCLSQHWNVSRERLILTIDLCAPDTTIGRLSLYHDIEKKVLIDLGLLTETFRHGLAEALLDKFPPRSSSTETGATARNGNAAVAEYYPEEISGD